MSSTVAIHRSVVHRKAGRVYLVREEEPARKRPISPEEGVIRTAAAVLMLASYRNQSIHIFLRPAMLATAIHITKTTQRGERLTQPIFGRICCRLASLWSTLLFTDELFTFFCFLQDVFSNEFIFIPGKSSQVTTSSSRPRLPLSFDKEDDEILSSDMITALPLKNWSWNIIPSLVHECAVCYCWYLSFHYSGLWAGMLPPEEMWSSSHQSTGSAGVRCGAGGAILPAGAATTLHRILSGPLSAITQRVRR